MKRKTILRKIPNRISSDDEFPDDLLIQATNLASDEFESVFDRDLLSGHDLLDMDGGLEDDYVCLDNFIVSQLISY